MLPLLEFAPCWIAFLCSFLFFLFTSCFLPLSVCPLFLFFSFLCFPSSLLSLFLFLFCSFFFCFYFSFSSSFSLSSLFLFFLLALPLLLISVFFCLSFFVPFLSSCLLFSSIFLLFLYSLFLFLFLSVFLLLFLFCSFSLLFLVCFFSLTFSFRFKIRTERGGAFLMQWPDGLKHPGAGLLAKNICQYFFPMFGTIQGKIVKHQEFMGSFTPAQRRDLQGFCASKDARDNHCFLQGCKRGSVYLLPFFVRSN